MFNVGDRVQYVNPTAGGPRQFSFGTVKHLASSHGSLVIEFDDAFPRGHDGRIGSRTYTRPGHGWFSPQRRVRKVEHYKGPRVGDRVEFIKQWGPMPGAKGTVVRVDVDRHVIEFDYKFERGHDGVVGGVKHTQPQRGWFCWPGHIRVLPETVPAIHARRIRRPGEAPFYLILDQDEGKFRVYAAVHDVAGKESKMFIRTFPSLYHARDVYDRAVKRWA